MRAWSQFLERWRTLRTLSDLSDFDSDVYHAWKRRQINDVEFMTMQKLINSKKKSITIYGGT